MMISGLIETSQLEQRRTYVNVIYEFSIGSHHIQSATHLISPGQIGQLFRKRENALIKARLKDDMRFRYYFHEIIY